MMQAHPAPARRYPCPGCATCRSERRDRVWAALVIVVFVVVFVVPMLAGCVVWRP